jgi:hypothetical protein
MDFIINTYESVGSIRFGMTSTEIYRILGNPSASHGGALEVIESFHEFGIQVCYNGNNDPITCVAIQFILDSDRLSHSSKPIFRDKNLLDGTSIEELKDWLESIDTSTEVNVDGVTCYELGIGLGTESYRIFRRRPPQTVIVFSRGYYDNLSPWPTEVTLDSEQ